MVNDAITAPGPKIASQRNGFAERSAGGGSGAPVCSECDWGGTGREYAVKTNL